MNYFWDGTQWVVNFTKSSIGLENVDNTSDLDKPVSTATQAALDLKVSSAPPASGSDDTSVLAGVIASAPAGSKIELDPSNGPYLISSSLTWAKKLFLDCRGATLTATARVSDDAPAYGYLIHIESGGNGTHITNGTFDSGDIARGTIKFESCDSVGVSNCRFQNKPAIVPPDGRPDTAVKFNNCSRPFVRGCSFYDWGYRNADTVGNTNHSRCIALSDVGCHYAIIDGNDFDTIFRGVDIVGDGHIIVNNKIRNRWDNGLYLTSSGTSDQLFKNITISGNQIYGGDEGIALTGADEASAAWCENITISNNIISGFAIMGIDFMHRLRNVLIKDNIIISDGSTLLKSDGVSVIGPPGSLISIRPGTVPSSTSLTDGFSIEGNRLIGPVTYAGIWMQCLTNFSLKNNNFNLSFPTPNLRFVKVEFFCDNAYISGNNFVSDSGTSVRGLWFKFSSSTNSKMGNNNFIGTLARYAYGDTAIAGLPYGFLEEGAADVKVYTSNGTWSKPSWATEVSVVCIGAGGGGGSGRRGTSGATLYGGGGGGGGGLTHAVFQASELGSTEIITVGTGGVGGVSQTTNDTNGNSGQGGGASSFGSSIKANANGGKGGGAGGTSAGAAATGGQGYVSGSSGGTQSSSTGNNGLSSSAGPGGGSGGGLPITPVSSAGGSGGSSIQLSANAVIGAVDAPGANGSNSISTDLAIAGVGGGGGSSSASGAGYLGGNGGYYGAGGGGGGASLNGFTSGAGGDGGNGVVIVISR